MLRLVERFVYDLGLLIAGHTSDLEPYVEASVAQRLRATLEPCRDGAGQTRPDFGEYAEVRITGDLLDLSQPVRAVAEFDDRSTRSDGVSGGPRVKRRVRLELILDAEITVVSDYRIEMA